MCLKDARASLRIQKRTRYVCIGAWGLIGSQLDWIVHRAEEANVHCLCDIATRRRRIQRRFGRLICQVSDELFTRRAAISSGSELSPYYRDYSSRDYIHFCIALHRAAVARVRNSCTYLSLFFVTLNFQACVQPALTILLRPRAACIFGALPLCFRWFALIRQYYVCERSVRNGRVRGFLYTLAPPFEILGSWLRRADKSHATFFSLFLIGGYRIDDHAAHLRKSSLKFTCSRFGLRAKKLLNATKCRFTFIYETLITRDDAILENRITGMNYALHQKVEMNLLANIVVS